MTLLFQNAGQSGLEIETPDGSWAPVAVFPPGTEQDPCPPVVLNVGDMLSYWSNGLLKSTVHRVKIPETCTEDRYSIVYFCFPGAATELRPIPSTVVGNPDHKPWVSEENPDRVITAQEYILYKLSGGVVLDVKG